jgi:uncharacterized protein YjbJ (UPF0337 family)
VRLLIACSNRLSRKASCGFANHIEGDPLLSSLAQGLNLPINNLWAAAHRWLFPARLSFEWSVSAIKPKRIPSHFVHSLEFTMNIDQVKARIKAATGKAKEVTGKVVGNKDMEQKGKAQKSEGKTQTALSDIKQDIKKNKAK